MKFGVREICDVVLKAKAPQKVGNKIFYANEPVLYFDTLKTSSMEGTATTVYAQGGRGNARLMAWDGERTVTFTMEDALISPEGFMILSGAGLIDATANKPIYQHITETVDAGEIADDREDGEDAPAMSMMAIHVKEMPHMPKKRGDNFAYVMLVKDGQIISEPFIPVHYDDDDESAFVPTVLTAGQKPLEVLTDEMPVVADATDGFWILVKSAEFNNNTQILDETNHDKYTATFSGEYLNYDSVIVDYYTARTSNARQIEITADKFGGNYYLEASTLFRDQNGVDMPAEFIIPNCKVQSNFTFTMASSGDPSSFTFTMDAFPDFTRFDKSKKVLAAIQIIEKGGASKIHRHATNHEAAHDKEFI